jgi:hypothetical protein
LVHDIKKANADKTESQIDQIVGAAATGSFIAAAIYLAFAVLCFFRVRKE